MYMKKLSLLFAVVLLFSLFFCITPCASAAETGQESSTQEIDFDNVDWSTIDWNTVSPGSLSAWIESQENLNKLFSLYGKLPEFDYSWSITLANRLLDDPAAFMRALALEEPELQTIIAKSLSSSVYQEIAPGFSEFPKAIYSTKLAEDDTAETRQVLVLFENAVMEYWGIPKTGDPVGVAVALLALSGLAGAVMITKRKSII
jgi:hypothetical protein